MNTTINTKLLTDSSSFLQTELTGTLVQNILLKNTVPMIQDASYRSCQVKKKDHLSNFNKVILYLKYKVGQMHIEKPPNCYHKKKLMLSSKRKSLSPSEGV